MTHRPLTLAAALLFLVAASLPALAGRYEQHTAKARQGPHLQPAGATYFGGEGDEEFVDVGVQEDGTIVAFGNAWGPEFPASPQPTVIGQGEPMDIPVKVSRGDMERANPGTTGMIVFYNSDLTKIERVTRLGWGTAGIEAGRVAPDGTLIVTGRSTQRLRDLAATAPIHNMLPQPGEAEPKDDGKKKKKKRASQFGPFEYGGATTTGDTYVMALDPSGKSIKWVWVFEGFRDPPSQLTVDTRGDVYVETFGLKRISADGKTIEEITEKETKVKAVDPQTGGFVIAGDQLTHTGREPWRKPYFHYHAPDGERQWSMWGWDEKMIGTDKYRLVSDSSVRDVVFEPLQKARSGEGESGRTVLVAGWSDGGNSVFKRQPTDIDRGAPEPDFISSVWGMKSASSIAYIMRINLDTKEQLASTYWVGFLPDHYQDKKFRGAPNGASISHIALLDNDAVGIVGGAATGMIQTPNAFVDMKGWTEKYGGSYVAVFDNTLGHLFFASYLPGCEEPNLTAVDGGVVVVSRSEGTDGKEPAHTTPISEDAPQKEIGGGWDAHILLLKFPK